MVFNLLSFEPYLQTKSPALLIEVYYVWMISTSWATILEKSWCLIFIVFQHNHCSRSFCVRDVNLKNNTMSPRASRPISSTTTTAGGAVPFACAPLCAALVQLRVFVEPKTKRRMPTPFPCFSGCSPPGVSRPFFLPSAVVSDRHTLKTHSQFIFSQFAVKLR